MAEGLYLNPTAVGEWDADELNFYFGPFAAVNDAVKSYNVTNYINKGKLIVTKQNVRTNAYLGNAGFTVSVTTTDSAAMAMLTGLGFSLSGGVYTKTISTGTASPNLGKMTLDGLPIYEASGTVLNYKVQETTAPSGYYLSDVYYNFDFGGTGAASDRTVTKAFFNSPTGSVVTKKLSLQSWFVNNGNSALSPSVGLSGVTLAIYKKTVSGSNVTLTLAGTGTTVSGDYTFTGLDSSATYVVVEIATLDNYDLPTGKHLPVSAAALAGTYTATEYVANFTNTDCYYNSFGEANLQGTSSPYKYTYGTPLYNYVPYAQFRLTKYGHHVDETDFFLLDHMKFQLYSSNAGTEGKAFASLTAGTDGLQAEGYTYETGNELGSTGTFLTNPQTYGRVYWLVETATGGYTADQPVIGPITGYTINGVTDLEAYNTVPTGGGGTARYLQVVFNKQLLEENGTFVQNLADCTFTLYLADASYTPIVALTTIKTGLDQSVHGATSAGRGISESIDMVSLYNAYGPTSGLNYVAAINNGTDYEANFVLVETGHPSGSTPTKTNWPFTASTGGSTYTTNNFYNNTGNMITNIKVDKAPLRIRKVARSASEATAAPWKA